MVLVAAASHGHEKGVIYIEWRDVVVVVATVVAIVTVDVGVAAAVVFVRVYIYIYEAWSFLYYWTHFADVSSKIYIAFMSDGISTIAHSSTKHPTSFLVLLLLLLLMLMLLLLLPLLLEELTNY